LKSKYKMTTSENLVKVHPLAITMWDFSWLERRWNGAGYEDWDLALDELAERGYNAVRIDAFPHLVSEDPNKEWELLPLWNTVDWGSPALNRVQVQPALNTFISKCKDRKIKVGLSTWYRKDKEDVRMKITSPEIMAKQWIDTLNSIDSELMNSILYVDLCNEWPHPNWAPFFKNDPDDLGWEGWFTENSVNWMKPAIEILKKEFPEMPFTFSIEPNKHLATNSVGFFDLLEPHIWMVHENDGEFYKKVDYNYDMFKPDSFNNLVLRGEKTYREKPEYWDSLLKKRVNYNHDMSVKQGLPLITTECWGVVDYKDWPLLNWDWVKQLCELGTITAAESGRWVAIATSNFCGPQFAGMWRDVAWHQRLTDIIKKSNLSPELQSSLLAKRLSIELN
jgi:hypothetical protein